MPNLPEFPPAKITTERIEAGAVTEAQLGNEAVTAAKIKAAAVTEEKIKAEAVAEEKLGAEAVGPGKLSSTTQTITKNIGSKEIMQPLLVGGAIGTGSAQLTPGAKVAQFCRAVVPQTGKVKDIAILPAAGEKGEVKIGIFDTGDAKAGEYTLLAESESKALGTSGKWESLGTLGGLSLTAGQHVLIGLAFSHAEGKVFGQAYQSPKSFELPTGYLPCPGGALPKLLGKHAFAGFELKTIKEAEVEEPEIGQATCPTIICRIS